MPRKALKMRPSVDNIFNPFSDPDGTLATGWTFMALTHTSDRVTSHTSIIYNAINQRQRSDNYRIKSINFERKASRINTPTAPVMNSVDTQPTTSTTALLTRGLSLHVLFIWDDASGPQDSSFAPIICPFPFFYFFIFSFLYFSIFFKLFFQSFDRAPTDVHRYSLRSLHSSPTNHQYQSVKTNRTFPQFQPNSAKFTSIQFHFGQFRIDESNSIVTRLIKNPKAITVWTRFTFFYSLHRLNLSTWFCLTDANPKFCNSEFPL